MGRKSKIEEWLTDEGLTTLEGYARHGMTDKQIAERIGVAERTFERWKAENMALKSALKKGKEPVDFEVESALLRSALGYRVTVRKPVKIKTETTTKQGKIVSETYTDIEEEVYIQPNVTAQIFWLKNRMPAEWRDRIKEAADMDFEDLTPLVELLSMENM